MPVATQGSVKALSQEDLEGLGVTALLSNSYHLYLRPGGEVLEKAGGLHAFMDYKGAILTDSGGYQVFSLADLRSISEDGVTFQSHLDGSRHSLTPESVIRFQARIGSDMWTTLDECPPYPCTERDALRALERTQNWSESSRRVFDTLPEEVRAGRLFFPVTQGSMYPALRRRAVEHIIGIGCDGIFDQLTNNEVIEGAWMTTAEGVKAKNIHLQCGLAVDMIIKSALARRTFDNVTVVMVAFKNFEKIFKL